MKKNRNVSFDLLRILAFVSVACIHFFLNSGFYGETVAGGKMFILMIIRSFFMICVPLFIMLTGYFMCKKTLCAKYYLGVVKVLVVYFVCSMVCLIMRKELFNEEFDFWKISSFTASDYAWYVNMYLGLFVLAPFLNAAWQGLKSKKQRSVLLITLCVLTALPSILNIFVFDVPGWWSNPTLSNEYVKLVPDWWRFIYPFTYYFMGAYICEYPVKLKKRDTFFLAVLSVLILACFSFYRSNGVAFIWGAWQDWGSPFIAAEALFVFLFFSSLKIEHAPAPVSFCISYIAEWTFGAYLLSNMFDKLFYPKFILLLPNIYYRFQYMPLTVLMVVLCSIALSAIINILYDLIKKLITEVIKTIKNKIKKEQAYAHT